MGRWDLWIEAGMDGEMGFEEWDGGWNGWGDGI